MNTKMCSEEKLRFPEQKSGENKIFKSNTSLKCNHRMIYLNSSLF